MLPGARRSRKTLIYLILTLNHCYPDYDFSLLRAHHFRKEPGVSAVEQAVDSHLLEASRVRVAAVEKWALLASSALPLPVDSACSPERASGPMILASDLS